MAKVPRTVPVDVDDAELIAELKKFHQDSQRTAEVKTVDGEIISPGDAVTLTEQAYTNYGIAENTPVYVHDINIGARIVWAAAFTKEGRKIIFFMTPEMAQKIHTTSTPGKKAS